MQKNYSNYSDSDFLQDDYFLKWQIFQEEGSALFWENFLKEYPEKESSINRAIEILHSVKLNDYTLSPEEKELLFNNLTENIKTGKRKKIIRFIVSTAASIALILACSYFFVYRATTSSKTLVETVNDSIFNDKDIHLILANNKTMAFDDDATIQHSKSNLVINSGNRQLTSERIDESAGKMNKLIVPKGKRSLLFLEDGTKIWVNSGTVLKYPPKFSSSKRDIYVEGEIYIEVAKNEKCPFYVHTSSFAVKVLGTCFNVSAYKEDSEQSIVLVEGSVEVEPDTKQKIKLQPDQRLAMTPGSVVTKKVNVYDYISWKDGLLQFRSEPLINILNRLSRHYGFDLNCDSNIKDMQCTGKLILFEDLESVLQTISNTIPIAYSKNGEKVTIHKK